MRTKLTEFVCKQYLQKIVDACYLDVYPLSSQKINVQLCFTILRISLFSRVFEKQYDGRIFRLRETTISCLSKYRGEDITRK